jgi:O-antigen ligase
MTSITGMLIVILGLIKFVIFHDFEINENKIGIPVMFFLSAIVISGYGHWEYNVIDSIVEHVLLGVMYFVIVNNISKYKQIKRMFYLSLTSITLAAVYGLYQHYYLGLSRVSGFMLTLSFGGMLAFFLVYFIVYLRWGEIDYYKKFSFLMGILLFSFNLFYNGSRSAWLALFGGIFILTWIKSKRFCIILVSLILIIAIILPPQYLNLIGDKLDLELDNSNRTRISLWKGALRIWLDHPINGVGVGNFQKVFKKGYVLSHSGTTVNAHNNFLQFAAEAGTLGLVTFGWFIYSIISYLYRSYQKSNISKNFQLFILSSFIAVIIFQIQGLANVNFLENTSIRFFWFWLALNVSLINLNLKEAD